MVINWNFRRRAQSLVQALRQIEDENSSPSKITSPNSPCACDSSSKSPYVALTNWVLERGQFDCTTYLSHPPVLLSSKARNALDASQNRYEAHGDVYGNNPSVSVSADHGHQNEIERLIEEVALDCGLEIDESSFGHDAATTYNENESDEPRKQTNDNTQYTEWSFSIVFSDTWNVPVLYFQCTHVDGTPLSRAAVLDILLSFESIPTSESETTNESNKVMTEEQLWEFVSHEEHPITGRPSFFLHPCQTSLRMELLLNGGSGGDQRNRSEGCPLLIWMSLIFPVVGCKIPSETFCKLDELMRINMNDSG